MKLKKKKKKSRVGPEIFGSVGEPETKLFFFFFLPYFKSDRRPEIVNNLKNSTNANQKKLISLFDCKL